MSQSMRPSDDLYKQRKNTVSANDQGEVDTKGQNSSDDEKEHSNTKVSKLLPEVDSMHIDVAYNTNKARMDSIGPDVLGYICQWFHPYSEDGYIFIAQVSHFYSSFCF